MQFSLNVTKPADIHLIIQPRKPTTVYLFVVTSFDWSLVTRWSLWFIFGSSCGANSNKSNSKNITDAIGSIIFVTLLHSLVKTFVSMTILSLVLIALKSNQRAKHFMYFIMI